VKRVLAGLGVVVGLGCVAYALFAGKTDEELIRERLAELETAIEVGGEPKNLAVQALQMKGTFSNLFEPGVIAHIPELGSVRRGRDELAALATSSRNYFASLDVDFEHVHVQIDAAGRNAEVDTRAELTALGRAESVPRREARAVRFGFFKHDEHGWRIDSVDVGDIAE